MHMNAYVCAHSSPPDAILRELAHETAEWYPGEVSLPIAPEQGTFMTILTRLIGARSAIEIGTFTGYSSICLARKYWDRAGLGGKIELRLGPALDTVRALPGTPQFDLAFIDADKTGYLAYWNEVVPRVRPGGAILVDNTFSHGRVLDAGNESELVQAVRDFNDHAAADDRVEVIMLPLGDGLTLARKK